MLKHKEIIAKMTIEEKASMFSGKDFWQTKDFPQYGIPSIFLADGPHGIRKQAEAADHLGLNESLKATCFPTAVAMANSFNVELGREVGAALGAEAVYQKVNVLLGPGLNIKRNPFCGRNFEYFSEDPYLAGKMAAAYVTGIQSKGISACLKHYAANNQETKRMIVDSVVDERTLREIYLTGFEIAVKEGKAKSVMSAYNKINSIYANEDTHLLKEILRDEWGFDGVIVTDWGGNNDRVEAVKAGNELEMPSNEGETNREIVAAVKDGRLDESIVDECLDRLLTFIFDTEKAFEGEQKPYNKVEHHKVAQQAAQESIVLLKNKGNILPLKPKSKVALIGDFAKYPRYQGAGSSIVNPEKVENALEEIEKYDLSCVGYEKGFHRYGKKSNKLAKKAIQLAKKADIILVYIGLDEASETEGLDRVSLDLPKNQLNLIDELVKTGKKVITILSCGVVVDMPFSDKVDAVVHGFLGGQAGASSMLNVLTGKVNPSGKLAETYPLSYGDVPSASNFPGGGQSVEYREGLYIGYRYYEKVNSKVKFPFGYGLSYTTFEFSNLEVSDKKATFTIKNTGGVAGAEVAQLYVSAIGGDVFRPLKELKGFKKVYLEVGESKSVDISFDEYSFRYYNIKTNKWEIEELDYNIIIGSQSAVTCLEKTLKVAGTGADCPYEKAKLPSYYSGKASNVLSTEFKELLGHEPPLSTLNFIKRKRILVDYNTAICDLRYSRGWTGRFFAGVLRFAVNFLKFIGKRALANVLLMGVVNMPVRGLSRMTGGMFSHGQLDGFVTMFNGKFFKGFNLFLKEGRKKKKRKKAEKKLLKV